MSKVKSFRVSLGSKPPPRKKSINKRRYKSKKLKHKGAVSEFFEGVYKIGGGIARARRKSRELKLKEAKVNLFLKSQDRKPSRFNPKGKAFRQPKRLKAHTPPKISRTKEEKRLDKVLRKQRQLQTKIDAIEKKKKLKALLVRERESLKEFKQELRKLKPRPKFTQPPQKLRGEKVRTTSNILKKPVRMSMKDIMNIGRLKG